MHRFRSNMTIANGSCESRSRNEEEVDARHLRRLLTKRSAATLCWLGRQELAGWTTISCWLGRQELAGCTTISCWLGRQELAGCTTSPIRPEGWGGTRPALCCSASTMAAHRSLPRASICLASRSQQLTRYLGIGAPGSSWHSGKTPCCFHNFRFLGGFGLRFPRGRSLIEYEILQTCFRHFRIAHNGSHARSPESEARGD